MYVGVPPDPPPPPGSPAADRPTRRPPRFGSTKGSPPPPTTPKTVVHVLATPSYVAKPSDAGISEEEDTKSLSPGYFFPIRDLRQKKIYATYTEKKNFRRKKNVTYAKKKRLRNLCQKKTNKRVTLISAIELRFPPG